MQKNRCEFSNWRPCRPTPRSAFSLLELLAVMAVIGVLLAIGLPAIARARISSKRLECVNNLRNIALAQTQFEQAFLRLPASGNISDPPSGSGAPFHSWAVSILPYLEQGNLWNKWNFSLPITDPVNAPLTKSSLRVYSCPLDISLSGGQMGDQSYVVNGGFGFTIKTGAGVADCPVAASGELLDLNGDGKACTGTSSDDADRNVFTATGLFFLENWIFGNTVRHHALADVDDGTSQTFMVSENVRVGFNPVDPQSTFASPSPNLVAFYIKQPCVAGHCKSGSVDYSQCNSGSFQINSGLGSPEGGSSTLNSFHEGGVNMAYADSHVSFLSANIDGKVYAALASPRSASLIGNSTATGDCFGREQLTEAAAITDPESKTVPWNAMDLTALVALGTLAASLRCFQLEQPGIWFDESSSCRWIEFSLRELLQRTARDCHPPFYWILLKEWAGLFGHSIGALRSMSSLFGAATVLATYGLVHDLPRLALMDGRPISQSRFAAGLAAFLVAISPFHVEWSQEMRMYSLGTFEVIVSTWLLVRGLTPGGPRTLAWCGYAVVGICSLYTLYFSLFTLATHGLFVVGRGAVNGRWTAGYFAAIAVIALGWAPWLPSLWSMYETVQTSFPQGPLSWPEFRELFWWMFVPPSFPWSDDYAKLLLIEISLVVVILLFCRPVPANALVSLCAITPIYAILNISLISQNLIARHRLILAQIFILIGWSLLVQRIRFSALRWSAAGLSVLVCCVMTFNYLQYREMKASLPGMRAAMNLIDHQRSDDDFVVFVNPMLYLNGIRYTSNLNNVRADGNQSRYPYFQGSSLTRESDYVRVGEIPATAETVFIVEARKWLGGTWAVHMSSGWNLVDEHLFPEFYGEIIVKQYQRRPQNTSTGS